MSILSIDELQELYNGIIRKRSGLQTEETEKKEAFELQTTLVIPDCHVQPTDTMDRFTAINKLIKKYKPDNIVALGDFLNLSSLSHWEKNNKLKMEGIRYKEDIVAGNNALDAMFEGINIKKHNIIWHQGNHECLDDKTELLTKRGWINYKDIKEDDIVLSINPDNKKSEWVNIDRLIIKKHDGYLNRISTDVIDLFATDDHGLFYFSRSLKKSGKVNLSELTKNRYYIPVSLSSENQDRINISNDMLKLLAWVLTDGYVIKKSGRVGIAQRTEKLHLPVSIIENLGFKYNIYSRMRNTTEICGKKLVNPIQESNDIILGKDASKIITDILTFDKKIPQFIHDLNDEQFSVFLNSVIDGDGSRHIANPETSLMVYGKKDFIDELQILCITHGYSASISEYRPGVFRLNICDRKFHAYEKNGDNFRKEPYTGDVWDLTVKNHNFMIRRNGKCHITSNCWAERYLEQYPQLHGHIDIIEDLRLRQRGIINIVPYKKYSEIGGVLFTHAPLNAAGQAISGKFAAQKASEITAKSMVFGHTHALAEYSCQRHGSDDVIQIYIAGCYFDTIDDYAEGTTMSHNHCVSLLTHWAHGRFDIQQISKERMVAGLF